MSALIMCLLEKMKKVFNADALIFGLGDYLEKVFCENLRTKKSKNHECFAEVYVQVSLFKKRSKTHLKKTFLKKTNKKNHQTQQ